MKYKVGDRVRVISSTNGHKFNIGEIVTIEKLYPDANPPHYKARNSGASWWVMDENIEDIKSRSDQFRERMEEIIKKTSDEHPYSVTGRPETYDQYNQGWEDACDVLEQRIMDAYNEVHK